MFNLDFILCCSYKQNPDQQGETMQFYKQLAEQKAAEKAAAEQK